MDSRRTPWMSWASCVIVIMMLSLTVCEDTLGISSNSKPELPSAGSCPDPEVIAPCKCHFNATLGMDMDCSNVTNEDDLRRVFSHDFAFTDFRKFTLVENYNITSLRGGDLGSASFTDIRIAWTYLSEIGEDALKGSLHTLITLSVDHNSLKSVPDVSNFTRLKYINFHHNQMTTFPFLASATILKADIVNNHIDDIPVDAIIPLKSLEELYLDGNSLTEIHPHTFTRNENLSRLGLGSNKLTTIPADAITLHGNDTYLGLYNNQITSLKYEALSSVTGNLWLQVNNLTEMSEKVFRPLLEDFVGVTIVDNPFKCGCDIAWLVLNETLLYRIDGPDDTRCTDGHSFADLDPEVYKVMCPNATAVPL